MACGTPVVAANASCLPEVVGDAGRLASPNDPADLAQALLGLLDDADWRAELAVRGQARAQGYTWQATATATALSYRRAAGVPEKDAGG
jgi:glycosyltransferase involved in cell wall biosynthesis